MRPTALAAGLFSLLLPMLAGAQPTLQLGDEASLAQTIDHARSALVVTYMLAPGGVMTRSLASLCQRGGTGDITFPPNEAIVGASVRRSVSEARAQLESAGCHTRTFVAATHLKAAMVDSVLYLSDRNFGREATILRDDDPADRSAVATVLKGQPCDCGSATFSVVKSRALQIEADVIAQGAGALIVGTESFGPGTAVYGAIENAAHAQRPTTLVVSAQDLREQHSDTEMSSLRRLQNEGVKVFLSDANAKFVFQQRGPGFIASANATEGRPAQVDWGKRLDDPSLIESLRRTIIATTAASAQPL